jgi:hypothetical protein
VRNIVVYVADAGSVSKGNFHWVCSSTPGQSSDDVEKLAESISNHLRDGHRVALGYESPLFVPCGSRNSLGKARVGECSPATGNRPFNAGAGGSLFATGLQSLAWVLRRVREFTPEATATTAWSAFSNAAVGLFVWEAFVSGSEKADSHVGDAMLAMRAFQHHVRTGDMSTASRISEPRVFSLAGAAILFAGLSADITLLTLPCVVLRPLPNQSEPEA